MILVDITYNFINWSAYVALAGYVKHIWKQGYWKEIHKKYVLQGAI